MLLELIEVRLWMKKRVALGVVVYYFEEVQWLKKRVELGVVVVVVVEYYFEVVVVPFLLCNSSRVLRPL